MTSNSLAELAISETGFVFDTRSGATFNVNPTGLFVLHSLREGTQTAAIAQALRERFEESPPDVMDHLVDFVRVLRQFGLIPDDTGRELPPSPPSTQRAR